MAGSLKERAARSLGWNVVDRLGTQVLYAVTGIVLARLLSQEAFGLVGAVLVFQAFASLFIDSGFSFALIQRRRPSGRDYSTVLWFNVAMAVSIYVALWFLAPWIARIFGGHEQLVPLSRVMFISFIINAATIVPCNRMTKRMDVRPVALTNAAGLAAGAVVGITIAVVRPSAWAIVWQTITVAAVRCITVWWVSHWRPTLTLTWRRLRPLMRVGTGMMATSLLNTAFQNVYALVIGNRVGLVSLGYYTQSDKWSKMGVMSLSQVLTSTFLPALSDAQTQPERFRNMTSRINRLTAYLACPCLGLLAVMATPIFHTLFGVKWDASISLFQLLLVRGIFMVMCLQYANYLVALGHARRVVMLEGVRDTLAAVALVLTWGYMALTRGTDVVWGIRVMLWGQAAAMALAWVVSLIVTTHATGDRVWRYLWDIVPYALSSAVIAGVLWLLGALMYEAPSWLTLIAQVAVGGGLYLGINYLMGSRIQSEALAYLRRRK